MDDVACPNCRTDEHVVLVERLTGSQRKVRCEQCGNEWLRGVPETPRIQRATGPGPGRRFPQVNDVGPARLALVEHRKAEFLKLFPEPEDVADYWAKYQWVFSAEGLPKAHPQDLKAFANSSVGARIGNMSNFNDEWNRLAREGGPETAADRVREVIEYLLRGRQPAGLEDRLTALLTRRAPVEMKGLKEAILTKVLCVVYPEKYVRYLVYTGRVGKREVAREVFGLELPHPDTVSWSIGHLIQWSNDLLRDLCGGGFKNLQHASDFLWWCWQNPIDLTDVQNRRSERL